MQRSLPTILNVILYFTPKDPANPLNNTVLIQDHSPQFSKDAHMIHSVPTHTDF